MGNLRGGAVERGEMITRGEWRVPLEPVEDESGAIGFVVMAGDKMIADCRNPLLPVSEQRSNADLCQYAPEMLRLLKDAEMYLGDLPARDKRAGALHRRILDVLRAVK